MLRDHSEGIIVFLMHPRLFTTPYFVFHTFGLFLAAAYFAALWWLMRGVRRDGLDSNRAASLGLWLIIGAILGAKALMVIRTLPDYLAHPSELWSLSTIQSAGDFYGGFIGSLIGALIFFHRHPDIPRWHMADLSGPAIALGQAIGRIGCFMAGDDYGRPTDLPWAVVFTHPDASEIGGAPLGIPLHPVQLYESFTCFLIFLFLVWRTRRKRFHGEIILTYTLLYAFARFLIEWVRGDADRGFVFAGMMSTSQFIAVIAVVICIPLWVKRSKTRLGS
jgi:phosphatidylglycerol:prolipoprotein diacylglycerol transferase